MPNKKKTTPVEEVEAAKTIQRYKGWDMSRIFWGLLLVLAGLLLLLDNFGVVEVHFGNLWQLWPLLIVGWGVSLLNIKGTWWNIVSAILMIASLGLIAWATIGMVPSRDTDNGAQSESVEQTSSAIELLDVTVEAGAGKIRIDSRDSDIPVEAVLRSDFAKLNIDSRSEGSTQMVNISLDGDRIWWKGRLYNELDVQLARLLPTNLKVDVGASDFDADLSEVMLERLDIDFGASSSVVTLGDLADQIDVNLSAGASSVLLRVPEGSGVSVKLDKGLSSQDLDGLQDKGDGLYQTADYEKASRKITIRGDIGATSFTLKRY